MTASNLKFDHDVLLGGCFNGGRLYGHWQVPDTVVINLGANDFGISPPSFATFSSALNNLLDRVQAMYGGSAQASDKPLRIVVACGPRSTYCHGDYQHQVVAQRGASDPSVSFVSLMNVMPSLAYPGHYTGCAAHPNKAGGWFLSKALLPSMRRS